MNGKELLDRINSSNASELFSKLYGKSEAESARQRYRRLVELHEPDSELRVFSVPGRTELGGNHTDHNRGKVLAASIHLDAVAVVEARRDKQVFFHSTAYPDLIVDLSELSLREEERGKTAALVRGIAAEFANEGTVPGGFTINVDSRVLPGSGLSSSAVIEVLLAKVFDNLYSGGKRSALELAKIGQRAENLYFGKPCGLMDQTACASGGAIAIDFADSQSPLVRGIHFDPDSAGIALCIVDTKGSHCDLTPAYAAIPKEMKAVAAFFGKSVLRELDEESFLKQLLGLRKSAGDRAVLRALHFFEENRRVDAMFEALEDKAVNRFLTLVNESGDSSRELLQNIHSPENPAEQSLGLALALTKKFFSESGCVGACNGKPFGACRVHGGGFAGTIQAYIPFDKLEDYRELMEGIFGKDALTVLRIRQFGAEELTF